jgi:hypothetical protein
VSRLHYAMPSLGARFVWHTMWRKARRGDPLAACTDLGAFALLCLQERARGDEEAERLEGQPGLASPVGKRPVRCYVCRRALTSAELEDLTP